MQVHTRNNRKWFFFLKGSILDTRLWNVPLEYFLSFHFQKKSRKVFLCSLRFSGTKNDTLCPALGFPPFWFQISWEVKLLPNSQELCWLRHSHSLLGKWRGELSTHPACLSTGRACRSHLHWDQTGPLSSEPPKLIHTHPGVAHSRWEIPSPAPHPTMANWRSSFYTFWKNIWAPQNREEHGKIPSGLTCCQVQTAYSLQRRLWHFK